MSTTTTTTGTPWFLSEWSPRLLSVLRIMAGLLYLAHGTQKLLGFPPMPAGRAMPDLLTLQGVSGILEVVLDIMYDMPSQPNIKEVVISEEVVNKNEPPIVVYTKAAESA